jgi:putative flippase GtrA
MNQTKSQSQRLIQKKKNRRTTKQIVEYLVSGGAYFWSGYLAFFIFYQWLHWTLFWAKIGADLVGWIVNYILQRYWVFNNPELSKHKTDVTGRYLVITAIDFLIDYIIVRQLNVVGISPYIGQFVSSGFFTVWNYFWYKYWVFPTKKTTRKPA